MFPYTTRIYETLKIFDVFCKDICNKELVGTVLPRLTSSVPEDALYIIRLSLNVFEDF